MKIGPKKMAVKQNLDYFWFSLNICYEMLNETKMPPAGFKP